MKTSTNCGSGEPRRARSEPLPAPSGTRPSGGDTANYPTTVSAPIRATVVPRGAGPDGDTSIVCSGLKWMRVVLWTGRPSATDFFIEHNLSEIVGQFGDECLWLLREAMTKTGNPLGINKDLGFTPGFAGSFEHHDELDACRGPQVIGNPRPTVLHHEAKHGRFGTTRRASTRGTRDPPGFMHARGFGAQPVGVRLPGGETHASNLADGVRRWSSKRRGLRALASDRDARRRDVDVKLDSEPARQPSEHLKRRIVLAGLEPCDSRLLHLE